MNTRQIAFYECIGETLQTYIHSSGLRVMVLKKPGCKKMTAVFSTSYGSIDNTFSKPGETEVQSVPDGIAHFLEHKLFEQKDMNILEKSSRMGANSNAFTSFDQTTYYMSCTDNFSENFELLLTYLQHPHLTNENVEKEKGIIEQEIRMYEDNADWRVRYNMLAAMYEKHPVRLEIAGTVESISGITKDLLYDCYNTFYSPSNMALAVVGDVDPESVFATVDRLIEQKENNGRVHKYYPEESAGVFKEKVEQKLAISMPLFMLGYRDDVRVTGSELLKRHTALSIGLSIIAGRSSDLFGCLYEKMLINESFDVMTMLVPAFGFVSFGGQSEKPEEAAEALKEATRLVVASGISKEDFTRIKKAQEGEFISSLDSSDQLARALVGSSFADAAHLELGEIYRTITKEDVDKVLTEVLGRTPVLSVIHPL